MLVKLDCCDDCWENPLFANRHQEAPRLLAFWTQRRPDDRRCLLTVKDLFYSILNA